MNTKIDPINPVRWLEASFGKLKIPKDSFNILQKILEPFHAELSDTTLHFLAQVNYLSD